MVYAAANAQQRYKPRSLALGRGMATNNTRPMMAKPCIAQAVYNVLPYRLLYQMAATMYNTSTTPEGTVNKMALTP